MPITDPRHILITGASSGIGESLALHYAAPGKHLTLTGRNVERLNAVAEACRAKGAEVMSEIVPVEDQEAMATMISRADAACPLDLVIANAGIGAGSGPRPTGDSAQITAKVMAVNVDGVVNTIQPAAALMVERKAGQLCIISSLASYRGLPGAASYCASKAAVRLYGESLRVTLARKNVGLTVVTPGFIRSRITDKNSFKMPFFMEAEPAARKIAHGLAKNRARIAFPWQMYWITRLLAALPQPLGDWLLSRGPSKS